MDNDSSSDESHENRFIHEHILDQGEDQDLLFLALIDAILSDDDDDNNDVPPTVHGGSAPGRAPNINRNRGVFEAHLNADYFGDNPTYSLKHFRRRFRMSRRLYLQIERRLQSSYIFFTQRADATGLLGINLGFCFHLCFHLCLLCSMTANWTIEHWTDIKYTFTRGLITAWTPFGMTLECFPTLYGFEWLFMFVLGNK